jgi:hypothetical protein
MNFLGIPDRINKLLYNRDIHRLTHDDVGLAKRWTLRLIRDGHPHWSEKQVERYYEKLSLIRVEVVDNWSMRNGWKEEGSK